MENLLKKTITDIKLNLELEGKEFIETKKDIIDLGEILDVHNKIFEVLTLNEFITILINEGILNKVAIEKLTNGDIANFMKKEFPLSINIYTQEELKQSLNENFQKDFPDLMKVS